MKGFQDLELPPHFKDMKLPNKPNQNQKAVKFHISDEEDLSDFDDDFFDDDEYDEYHPPLNKIKKPIMGNGGRPGMMPNNMMMMNGNHPRLMNAQNGAPNAAQNDKKGGNNNNNNNQPKGRGGGQQPNPQQQLQQMKGFQELKLPPHFKDLKLPNMPIQNQNQKAVKFSNPDDDEDFSGFDDDEFDDESDDEDDEYHPPPNKMKPIMGNVGPPRMTPNNMMKMMNGNHPQLMNAQNGAPNAAQNDKKGGNNNNNNNQPKGGGGGQQQNPQQQLLQQLLQMKRFQDLKLPPLFKDMKLPNHPPPNKMKPIPGNVGPPRMTPNNMMTMMNGNHPQLTNAQNCAPNAAQNAKKGSSNNSNNNQPKGGGGGQQPNPQQQLQQMKGFQDLKLPPHFKDRKLPNMPNQNQTAVKFNIPNDDEDFSGLDDDDDEYDEPHPPPNKMKPIMDNGGPPGMMPNNMMMMMKGNHPQLMNARNCAPNVAQNAKKVGNNNNQPKGGGGGQQPNPQKQQLQQLQQMEGFQDRKLPPHFKDMKLPNMPNQNQRAVKFNISDDDGTSSDFDDDFFDDDEYDEHHPPLNKMKPIMGNVGPPRMTPNNMMKMMNGNHPQLMNAQNCAPNAAQNAKKDGNNNNNQPKGGGGGQQQNPQQQLQQMKGFQDLKLPPHFNDMKLPNVLNQNHKAFKFNISDDDEDISDFDDEFSDDDEYDEHHPPLNEMKPIMGSGGPPGTMPNNIMMNGNRPQLLLHGFGDDDLRLTFSPAAPAACQVNEQYQWQNIKVYQLLGKHKKRSLAVFYLVLEAASFLLDLYGKSERALLLAAFLLSAFGFAMCTYTCIMGRSRGSTSVQIQKQLVRTVEIAFSVVQLIVTLVYFILAEIHVKNNFSVSVFPLVFAVIIAVFTFKNDGGASDSSGHEDDDLYGDPPV